MYNTDIFKFLFLHPAVLKDAKELKESSIYLKSIPSSLYKEFVSLKKEGEYDKLTLKASDTFKIGKVFTCVSDLQDEYFEEEKLLKWVMEKINDKSISVAKFKKQYLVSNIDFSKESILWDNLIVHSILNNPIGIIDLIVGLIRLKELVDNLKDNKIKTIKDIMKVMQLNVILPQDIFPIDVIESNTLDKDIEKIEIKVSKKIIQTNDEIYTELAKLEKAKTELKKLYSIKLRELNNQSITFEDYKIQQDRIKNGFKEENAVDTDKILKNTEHNVIELEQKKQYSKILKQRNARKINLEEIKKFSKSTKEIIADLTDEEFFFEEIPEIVNQIDQKKSEVAINIISGVENRMSFPNLGGNLESFFSDYDNLCLQSDTGFSYCSLLNQLRKTNPKQPIVNILGIGDLKVIRQKLLRYEAEEIATIKNVFAGEEYTRSHRDLIRTEEFYETEIQKEVDEKNEIATTDRFEMTKEISEQVAKSSEKELGVNISAGYGPVSVSANASFASSASSDQTSKSASNYAKEITQKAINSIREKTREIRRKTTINEIETINGYKLINDSPEHKIGKYLWVNKVYQNQLYNLGKRLMLEFYIPSPLAFYIFSKKGSEQVNGVSVPSPIHPSNNKDVFANKSLKSHKDISRENADKWLSAYNVIDFSPAPSEYINIQHSFYKSLKFNKHEHGNTAFSEEIAIPNNYLAKQLTLRAGPHIWNYSDSGWSIFLNNDSIYSIYGSWNGGEPVTTSLPNIKDKVYLSGIGRSDLAVLANVVCELSPNAYEEWQISIYKAIMESYGNMKEEYDRQNSIVQINAGIQIEGNNPELNMQIIQEELQKWCIEALLFDRFEGWNAMKKATTGEPEIDFNQLKKETPVVSFITRAFEFENMTYQPYPYFWGNKKEHPIIRELSDTDPKFMAMLKAGYCRVIIPVGYGYETSVLHLIKTGVVWLGGDLPILDDPLFQSIVDTIKGKEYDHIGEPEDSPWETVVPTNLVWLQNSQPDGQL